MKFVRNVTSEEDESKTFLKSAEGSERYSCESRTQASIHVVQSSEESPLRISLGGNGRNAGKSVRESTMITESDVLSFCRVLSHQTPLCPGSEGCVGDVWE